MSTDPQKTWMGIARFGAIAVALGVGGYLVVTAQRRAQGDYERAPTSGGPPVKTSTASEGADTTRSGAHTVANPTAGTDPAPMSTRQQSPSVDGTSGTLLQSSKVMVLDGAMNQPEDPAFLFGSKSGMVTTTTPAGPDDVIPAPTGSPVFLPTSKSAAPVLLPSSKRLDAPVIQTSPAAPTTGEPVLLPNSKSKVIGSSLRPASAPPETVPPPVLLPSSKSGAASPTPLPAPGASPHAPPKPVPTPADAPKPKQADSKPLESKPADSNPVQLPKGKG